MIKNKTIFITGGAGFIANNLIKRLVDNNQIIIFDNFHRDTFSKSELAENKNIKVIRGDVLDYAFVKESMVGSDVTPGDRHPHPRLWGTFPRVFMLQVLLE